MLEHLSWSMGWTCPKVTINSLECQHNAILSVEFVLPVTIALSQFNLFWTTLNATLDWSLCLHWLCLWAVLFSSLTRCHVTVYFLSDQQSSSKLFQAQGCTIMAQIIIMMVLACINSMTVHWFGNMIRFLLDSFSFSGNLPFTQVKNQTSKACDPQLIKAIMCSVHRQELAETLTLDWSWPFLIVGWSSLDSDYGFYIFIGRHNHDFLN